MNTVNQAFHARLLARNDILLTQTILNRIFCIRFAIGCERTREGDIYRAVEIIVEEAESVVKEFRVKNDNAEQGIENGSANGGI
jgi:aromatic-L-amino-acid decarboxylase